MDSAALAKYGLPITDPDDDKKFERFDARI
jgi:hypothetical protein